ncbi:MAG: hypothetical protein AAGH40_03960, partial [Verrucomicrobiota bacterium]
MYKTLLNLPTLAFVSLSSTAVSHAFIISVSDLNIVGGTSSLGSLSVSGYKATSGGSFISGAPSTNSNIYSITYEISGLDFLTSGLSDDSFEFTMTIEEVSNANGDRTTTNDYFGQTSSQAMTGAQEGLASVARGEGYRISFRGDTDAVTAGAYEVSIDGGATPLILDDISGGLSAFTADRNSLVSYRIIEDGASSGNNQSVNPGPLIASVTPDSGRV